MTHAEFSQNGAVERYLLREMNSDEQTIFEEHYFECRICAADVMSGTRMMEAGREVARDAKDTATNVVPMPGRVRWFPQAAAAAAIFAMLGGGAGYQLALRRMPPPATESHLVPDTIVEIDPTRSAAVSVPRAGAVLKFDIFSSDHPWAEKFIASVQCGGRVVQSDEVSLERASNVRLVVRELPAGHCGLLIEGAQKDGIRRSVDKVPFEVVGAER